VISWREGHVAPGLAVVVGVDHLQEAGAGREQRLVGIFPIGEEHVATGLFLSILGDGDVSAFGHREGGWCAIGVRDASILIPGIGGTLAVMQEVASLLVDAEAGIGIHLNWGRSAVEWRSAASASNGVTVGRYSRIL